MIPITLSSGVCEYSSNTTSLIQNNNISSQSSSLSSSSSQLNNENNNISSNSMTSGSISNTASVTSPTNSSSSSNGGGSNSLNNSSEFIPISQRPCLALNKEYQYCGSTNLHKSENPLKHLYENNSSNSDTSSISDYDSPKPSSPIYSPSIQSYVNTNIDNEQISNSLNFELMDTTESNNNNNNNNNNNTYSKSTSPTPNLQTQQTTQQPHPQSLKKRSTSFSVRNVNLLSHQVAGQAPLLKLPDGKVLKPLVPKEYQFYESLKHHKEFLGFTPQFFGVLDLKNFDFQHLEESFKSHPLHSFDYNHWRNKIISLPKDYQNLYIKIEDLTYLCKCPCILDLKIGTRQYGYDAPLEKIKAMEEKCRNTTSSSLGFRVCGLKVYDQKSATYSSFDKFYGRGLKKDEISSIICKFIDNGLRHRIEILVGIAKRLYQLISLFEQQQCFKFYGSSLLLIYDGQSTNLQDAKINIKMVDFAHATPNYLDRLNNGSNHNNIPSPMLSSSPISNSLNNNNYGSPISSPNISGKDLDEGYLFGLKNLLKIINNLIQVSNSSNGGTI